MLLSSRLTSRHSELLQKLAMSRMDREIAAGNIQFSDVMPQGVPTDNVDDWKRATRKYLSSMAPRDPGWLDRLRTMNKHLMGAQLKAPPSALGIRGARIMNGADELSGDSTTAYTDLAKLKAPKVHVFTLIGDYLRNKALKTDEKHPSSGTIGLSVLQHEIGEASTALKPKKWLPFSSHLGPEPVLREQLRYIGDPEAHRVFDTIRQRNPDDALVARLIKSVGGTPDSPLPLDGRQENALRRLITKHVDKLEPNTRSYAVDAYERAKKQKITPTIDYLPQKVVESLEGLSAGPKSVVDRVLSKYKVDKKKLNKDTIHFIMSGKPA